MTYKMPSYIIFAILLSFVSSQTIDETLDEIARLKKEITQNQILVEQKISDMQSSNPLFAEKDIFESDQDYLQRMAIAMPEFDKIRKQYLSDLWHKMSILRARLFETENIVVTLRKEDYDANNEQWPIKVIHNDYQKESIDMLMEITKTEASSIYKNWSKVQKKGILTIDTGDKIGLAKVLLKDPITGFEFVHEIQPMTKYEMFLGISRTDRVKQPSLLFTPNGFFVISMSGRGIKLQVHNLFDNNITNVDMPDQITNLALSPDGKLLAAGSGVRVYLYSLQYGEKKHGEEGLFLDNIKQIKTFDNWSSSLAFSPDGKFLATVFSTEITLLNIEKGKIVKTFTQDEIRRTITDIDFSPDGKFIAAGIIDGHLNIFNTTEDSQKAITTPYNIYDTHTYYRGSVSFSPDGKWVAFNGQKGEFHIFELNRFDLTPPLLRTDDCRSNICETDNHKIASFIKEIVSLSFSPDSKYIGLSDGASSVIYDYKSKKVIKKFNNGGGVSFSPDGRYFSIGGKDGYSSSNASVYRTFLTVDNDMVAENTISRPPSLSASISFTEPSDNNFLDALETGEIALTINNSGGGPGKGILAKISPGRTENLNYNNSYIDEIPSGKSETINIPIEAYIGIKDEEHTFRIDFEEMNGFPPDPVELQFSTRAYSQPELYVVDVGIEDGNQNGKIETGEMIKLIVRIGNKGKGTAEGAYAKFYSTSTREVFITETFPKIINMGNLAYNNHIDIPLEFFINDRTKEKIPLYVDLTEKTNLASVDKLRIPINKSERTKEIGRTVITGIDQNYNDLKIGEDLSVDIERDIPTGKTNKNSVAIIIGNKNYTHPDVPEVTFAHRDAAVMDEYLGKALGYDDIIVAIDATYGKFNSLFGSEKNDGKLQDYIVPGESDVFIYYSGHGAPDPESKDGYFVPVDCDPAMVDVNGYSLDLFYRKLNSLKANNITVIIDACFSGSSDQGMLLKNISPVFIEVAEVQNINKNLTVFTSASGDQVSSWYPDKKHSLYTYYFLKGLKGEADSNNNNSITINEIHTYAKDKVSRMARKLNSRTQSPELRTSNANKELINY